MASENGITKQTKVSVEILITLITLTAAIIGSFVRAEMNNARTREMTAELKGQFTTYAETTTDELKRINQTLVSMLTQQTIENQINELRMGDRWTATMQEDFQDEWFELISSLHPEIKKAEIPSVDSIQRKNIERLYNKASGASHDSY